MDVLRSQFGRPSGLFGSAFIAPLMNIANMRLVNASIQLLRPAQSDRVLDVGFGGGYSLHTLAALVSRGEVIGVDYSQEMALRAAEATRLRGLGRRVRIECADVAYLPFPDRTFDRALTVNSIYYWPDPASGIRELARILKPGGRLAIGVRSPATLRLFTLTWQGFRLYERHELEQMMEAAGFRVLPKQPWEWWRIPDLIVLTGEKRSSSE